MQIVKYYVTMNFRKEGFRMDIANVTSLISTVGFPIAACIYMAYIVKDMNDKHKTEMDAMRDAINSNTNAINKLEALINQLMLHFSGK